MNDSDSLRWLEIFGYGFLIWIVVILSKVALYGVKIHSDTAFIVLVITMGLGMACVSTILYLPKCSGDRRIEGLALAFSWVIICIGLDILVYSSGLGTSLGYGAFTTEQYLIRDGWTYSYLIIVAVSAGFLSHASDTVQRRAEGAKSVMDHRP